MRVNDIDVQSKLVEVMSYNSDSTARIADKPIFAMSDSNMLLVMTGSANDNVILRISA